MKIFLSFLQSPHQYPIPAYSFWEYYIKNGITENGDEWVELPQGDWALGLVPQSAQHFHQWKTNIWERTVRYLKENPVDLFLSYLYPSQVDSTAIREIKKLGIPCINFFCDNVREFEKIPQEYAVFDCNWVPEYKALKMYKKVGYSYLNLPMPMWIEPRYRVIEEEAFHQLTFIGSYDIQRHLFFKNIRAEMSMEFKVYGTGWASSETHSAAAIGAQNPWQKIRNQFSFVKKHGIKAYKRKLNQRNLRLNKNADFKGIYDGKPDFATYIDLTKKSTITLGANRYPSFRFPLHKPDTYSRLRDIEAPMLGACYLTEWTEGLDELYDLDNEIWTYRSREELIEKVQKLHKEPSFRKKMKINAQLKALQEHSISNSLTKIKQQITRA